MKMVAMIPFWDIILLTAIIILSGYVFDKASYVEGFKEGYKKGKGEIK